MVIAVRVIKIIGNKDDCFSTLGDVTKNECLSNLKEGGAEILSIDISNPQNLILLPELW